MADLHVKTKQVDASDADAGMLFYNFWSKKIIPKYFEKRKSEIRFHNPIGNFSQKGWVIKVRIVKTLKELQDEVFAVLCLVDDICRKENIPYFLYAGTEIGAVREKDIIPWDDDIDINILRKDYPAFKAAMNKNLPEKYRFVEPIDRVPHFFDFVSRVIREDVYIREKTEETSYYKNFHIAVGIDVFIIDDAPDSTFKQQLMLLQTKMIYGMAISKRYKIDWAKYSAKEFLQVGFLTTLGRFFSMQSLCAKWDKLMLKYSQSSVHHTLVGNAVLRDLKIGKKEWYDGTTCGELRGRKFPIPKGYDEDLRVHYGDYMHPPKDRSIYEQHFAKKE